MSSCRSARCPRPPAKRLGRWLLERQTNDGTRQVYAAAVATWLIWCRERGVGPLAAGALHAAAWRDELARALSNNTVCQRLSAARGLYKHWVRSGVLKGWQNPFLSVSNPRIERSADGGGLTPLLPDEALRLLLPHPARSATAVEARDQALLGLLYFGILRRREAVELFVRGKRTGMRRPGLLRDRDGCFWIWAHRKRDKWQEIPVHPHLKSYLTAYLRMAAIGDDHDGPLLRPWARGGFRREPLRPNSLCGVVRRRFKELGVQGSPESLRASALTRFVGAGGATDTARNLAGHQSIDTTALYAPFRFARFFGT